jgi:glycosyltransferase involved in cell wall biosynthesis
MLTTRFIAVSRNAEMSWFGSSSIFNENLPLKNQHTHVTIYNSVDIDRIHMIADGVDSTILKNSIGIPAKVPVIGAVSRLSYEKGIDILLTAFKLLIKEGFNGFLLIVGSGPDEFKLNNQAKVNGISDKVCFIGEAEWDTAIQFMSIMDIVIVPSRFEGFGLTALEAMCLEKPVIASNCGGLKEVVEDKKTGLLCEPDNPGMLAESIKEMFTRVLSNKEMGLEGLQRAKCMFSLDPYILKISHLFQ